MNVDRVLSELYEFADECDRLADMAAPAAFRDGYRIVAGRIRHILRDANTMPAPGLPSSIPPNSDRYVRPSDLPHTEPDES